MGTSDAPLIFWSYAEADDKADNGFIRELAKAIEREVQSVTGQPFRVLVGRDPEWGTAWRERVDARQVESAFFVPLLTPAYLARPSCLRELSQFLDAERRFGFAERVVPIIYREIPDGPRAEAADALLHRMLKRQHENWCQTAPEDAAGGTFSRRATDLARKIQVALNTRMTRPPATEGDAARLSMAPAPTPRAGTPALGSPRPPGARESTPTIPPVARPAPRTPALGTPSHTGTPALGTPAHAPATSSGIKTPRVAPPSPGAATDGRTSTPRQAPVQPGAPVSSVRPPVGAPPATPSVAKPANSPPSIVSRNPRSGAPAPPTPGPATREGATPPGGIISSRAARLSEAPPSPPSGVPRPAGPPREAPRTTSGTGVAPVSSAPGSRPAPTPSGSLPPPRTTGTGVSPVSAAAPGRKPADRELLPTVPPAARSSTPGAPTGTSQKLVLPDAARRPTPSSAAVRPVAAAPLQPAAPAAKASAPPPGRSADEEDLRHPDAFTNDLLQEAEMVVPGGSGSEAEADQPPEEQEPTQVVAMPRAAALVPKRTEIPKAEPARPPVAAPSTIGASAAPPPDAPHPIELRQAEPPAPVPVPAATEPPPRERTPLSRSARVPPTEATIAIAREAPPRRSGRTAGILAFLTLLVVSAAGGFYYVKKVRPAWITALPVPLPVAENPVPAAAPQNVLFRLVGSTTVGIGIAQPLVEKYLADNNRVVTGAVAAGGDHVAQLRSRLKGEDETATVTIESLSSGKAVPTMMKVGKTDPPVVGMWSRPLTPKEKQQLPTLAPVPFASDGIALIVNPGRSLARSPELGRDALTMTELQKIFSGVISTWGPVGDSRNQSIKIVIRDRNAGDGADESGTMDAFVDTLWGYKPEDAERAAEKRDNIRQLARHFTSKYGDNGPHSGPQVAEEVLADEDAIGFVSLSDVGRNKVLRIFDDRKPGDAHPVLAPTPLSIANGLYPFSRELSMGVLDGAPPIARYFLDFVKSHAAQEIVKARGFVPVEDAPLLEVDPNPARWKSCDDAARPPNAVKLKLSFDTSQSVRTLSEADQNSVEKLSAFLIPHEGRYADQLLVYGFYGDARSSKKNLRESEHSVSAVQDAFHASHVTVMARGCGEPPDGEAKNHVELWVVPSGIAPDGAAFQAAKN